MLPVVFDGMCRYGLYLFLGDSVLFCFHLLIFSGFPQVTQKIIPLRLI